MAIFLVVGFFGWLALSRGPKSTPWKTELGSKSGADAFTNSFSVTEGITSPIAKGELPVRGVFRYSVIPGGVKSVEELKNAIVSDPVVSAHYAAFHLSRARIIRLDQDRSMHVSYRVGSRVYWTKRKLKLIKGETLITDGVQSARTRCGNLISEIASEPVIVNEPTVQELDEPQESRDSEIPIASNFLHASPLTQIPSPVVVSAEAEPPSQGNENYLPGFLGPPGPAWPTSPRTPHVTSVQPNALLLLSIGICTLVILQRVRAFRSWS